MTPRHKNADVLSALLKICDHLPIRLETIHVKGHQDQSTSAISLSPEAIWNIKMDARAKELLQTFHTCPSLIPPTSTHPWSFPTCKWNDIQITQETSNELYYHITHERITSYWVEKKRIPSSSLPFIDFDAMTHAQSFPLYLQHFATKWFAECIATGQNMQH